MKIIRWICLLIAALTVFSACSSVYEDMPELTRGEEETEAVNIDTSGEYFTSGSVNGLGRFINGYYYNGSWIYVETQLGIVPIANDNGTTYFAEKTVKRFVKYNPNTGIVSSPCLSPSCTHSPGSDCVMMINEYEATSYMPICLDKNCDHSPESDCVLNKKQEDITRSYLSSYAIYDDWMFIVMTLVSRNYGNYKEMTLYNLKTGQTIKEFAPDVGDLIMTTWDGNSYHEGKLYKIKKTLDYTNTGYDPNGDKKATDYVPETVFTLCEYDIATQKITELFEVPNYYGLQSVSNKRFYFAGLEDDYFYSCTRDGKDFRREKVRTILSNETIGSYVYEYTSEGVIRYDVVTDTQTEIKVDFTLYGKPIVTDNGIYYSTYTTIDEVNILSRGPDEDQTDDEWADEMVKLMYGGTAQIWLGDHEGNNLELVFEKENSQIDVMFADNKYIFIHYLTGEGALNYNMARSVINTETEEIIQIPYLEMLLPPGYITE